MYPNSATDGLEHLKNLLRDLSHRSPILGAAIFSIEGLPFVSHFTSGIEEVSVAAMVASIQAVGEQTVKELRQGELKAIIIQGSRGTTLTVSIAHGYLLTVTAPDNAKLGLIFNDAKICAREAETLLENIT
ncbi:MAG: roadblock/LC7 domain-containing protein [Candidatus Thorarchaeota archaeon]|nr:roadblock/LC7 domain-containing protein [Candidatus Thorarchaeota archaeon]